MPRAMLDTLNLPDFRAGRDVLVLKPPGYDTTSEYFPVAYVADAQEFFASQDGWYGDRMIPQLILNGDIPPVIIVGVASLSGPSRLEEYAPWNGSYEGSAITGGGMQFLTALRDTLKPEIERRYRCRPQDAYFIGSSIAGLLALEAAYDFDSTFVGCAAVSATLGWSGGVGVSYIATQEKPMVSKLYLDVGTVNDNSVELLETLALILREQGFVDGIDLLLVVQEGHSHSPVCWGTRLPGLLRFLLNSSTP